MPQRLTVALSIAVAVVVGGTAIAQTAQRFSDVPSDHEAHEAVEWAASVGLTVGYDDGTFGPDDPLSRWQAVTFMEHYYDNILQASKSGRFTRGDMMMLLKAIDDGDSTAPPTSAAPTTAPPTTAPPTSAAPTTAPPTTAPPTTAAPTTAPPTTAAPRHGCTHWHAGHPKHTHFRGGPHSHTHAPSSRTKCGWIFQ